MKRPLSPAHIYMLLQRQNTATGMAHQLFGFSAAFTLRAMLLLAVSSAAHVIGYILASGTGDCPRRTLFFINVIGAFMLHVTAAH
jgi:hypothetical protein